MTQRIDFLLLLSVAILVGMGLLIHYSLSPETIDLHLGFVAIGLGLAVVMAKVNLKLLSPYYVHLIIVAVILLTLTLVVGDSARGSARWLDLGFVRFQTAELIKFLMILAFPKLVLVNKTSQIKNLIFTLLVAAVPILLIFLQPDLGTALILAAVIAAIIFTSGAKLKHLIIMASVALALSPVFWFSLKDYQQQRVVTFINPATDPLGRGYNSIQSIVAVGSGQIIGKGLGHGTQSQLKFLPEYKTDFVFAALSEELGLVGSLLIISAYYILITRLISIVLSLSDPYLQLVAVGITTMLATQIVINIGMNVGIMPITGITLPFISSGGTSMVVSLGSIGLLIGLTQKRLSAKSTLDIAIASHVQYRP